MRESGQGVRNPYWMVYEGIPTEFPYLFCSFNPIPLLITYLNSFSTVISSTPPPHSKLLTLRASLNLADVCVLRSGVKC